MCPQADERNLRLSFVRIVSSFSSDSHVPTTSKKDAKNPDENLRFQNIVGIVSQTGLKWNGKEFADARIYDPPSGKTYKCKAWVEGDKLYLRGFLGFSMMGKTVAWHRYPANTP